MALNWAFFLNRRHTMNETINIGSLERDFPILKEYLQKEMLNKFPNTDEEDKIRFLYLNIIEQTIKNLGVNNNG